MTLFRPRLTDHHGIYLSQAQVDFAIQLFDEDIPLYVDPFLLWKSPSLQDQALHTAITNSFNYLNFLSKKGRATEAINLLVEISECSEVGLGVSKSRNGNRISAAQARKILDLFSDIPEYSQYGFSHFEIIQLYVEGIAKDRISDFTCNYIKSFLIDYTIEQCEQLKIPMEATSLSSVYNYQRNSLVRDVSVTLPVNPITKQPLIFTPKRWLRFNPWISFESYFKDYCPRDKIEELNGPIDRVKVLTYNRDNYGLVNDYLEQRLKQGADCKNDPLFSQIPVLSAKRKLAEILKLPTGKEDGADWKYEDAVGQLLATLLYPQLDFATFQSRTDSGRHIRDMVFYNNRDVDFLDEIFTEYGNRQIVVEMKNVAAIDRDHINQLNRYLSDGLGKFGIFLTRHNLSKPMFSNTVDLWSAQRRCIISLTDEDLRLMVEVYESKQRSPIDVLKKKYVEFRRSCPT